jgi:3-isopropylmalate dehydrogenase
MADKSNAMQQGHALWQRVFKELAPQYPGIEATHYYIDALAMYMVLDPGQFEVIVTNNLFGDIITDLGATFQGGLGMAASGNLHPGRRRCSSRCTARRRSSPGRTSPTRLARSRRRR